jgi:hypothetical protein
MAGRRNFRANWTFWTKRFYGTEVAELHVANYGTSFDQ